MAARESQVDATIPADNVRADKADFRDNFSTIKTELTQVLRENGLPHRIAFGKESV